MKKFLFILILFAILGAVLVPKILRYTTRIQKHTKAESFVKYNKTVLKEGDIIFQTSLSSQSKAIQIATRSKYSHMGMITLRNNKYYVFEAVQPVKLTPLSDWIAKGKDLHFVIKRLRDRDKYLTDEILNKMKDEGKKFIGKRYDLYFNWSDDQIYCSELVWKLYKAVGIKVGKLQTLGDFDLSSTVVKKKLRERYGNNIPYNEPVISPSAIFNSDLLVTVYDK